MSVGRGHGGWGGEHWGKLQGPGCPQCPPQGLSPCRVPPGWGDMLGWGCAAPRAGYMAGGGSRLAVLRHTAGGHKMCGGVTKCLRDTGSCLQGANGPTGVVGGCPMGEGPSQSWGRVGGPDPALVWGAAGWDPPRPHPPRVLVLPGRAPGSLIWGRSHVGGGPTLQGVSHISGGSLTGEGCPTFGGVSHSWGGVLHLGGCPTFGGDPTFGRLSHAWGGPSFGGGSPTSEGSHPPALSPTGRTRGSTAPPPRCPPSR